MEINQSKEELLQALKELYIAYRAKTDNCDLSCKQCNGFKLGCQVAKARMIIEGN